MTHRHFVILLSLVLGCGNNETPPSDGQGGQGGSSGEAPPLETPFLPECTGTPCTDTDHPAAECCPGTYCEVVSSTGGGGGSGGATASEKACLTEPGNACRVDSECATGGQQSFCNAGRCCFTDEGGESCRVWPGYACASNDRCTTLVCIDGICGSR
jgi:hypothetical protein